MRGNESRVNATASTSRGKLAYILYNRIEAFAGATKVDVALVEVALWAAGVKPLTADRDPFAGFSGALDVFRRREPRDVRQHGRESAQRLRQRFHR